MSRDPAVLWYFNDWQGGTITLSRHLKGCYMDLLHAQFNSGHLSLDEIKTVLGSDFGQSWPTLQKKFVKDESTGLYYNSRLIFEAEKRKSYTSSRRQNLNGEKKEKTNIPNHMEIDNVISLLPKDWIVTEFTYLLDKWAKKRKKKPDTDLAILRVSELIERYPKWVDAKKAMTEAANEGWLKFVYSDNYKKADQEQPKGKYDHERHTIFDKA